MRRNQELALLAKTVVAKTLPVLGIVCCTLSLATCTGCRGAIVTGRDSEIALLDAAAPASSKTAENNNVYYLVVEGDDPANIERPVPLTEGETVLDAVYQIRELPHLSSRPIWITRPGPDGDGPFLILPVDWNAIVQGGSTATNYRVLPNDRICIAKADWRGILKEYRTKVVAWVSWRLGRSRPGFPTLGRSRRELMHRRENADNQADRADRSPGSAEGTAILAGS